MFAPRPALTIVLTAGLVLPDFGMPASVRAQAAQSAGCAAGDRLLNQQGADKQAAESAWRIHWARRHPQQLGRYQQSLRASLASQRLAPEFNQIAADLVFYVAPFMDDRGKLWIQQGMLQLVDQLAGVVPVTGRPIPADPPTGARLKEAVTRTTELHNATMLRQFTAQCYGAPAAAATNVATGPANPASGGATALYSRSPVAVPISGSEASTPQVCAETKAVLVQLEREEREARDGLRRPLPAGASRAEIELKYERAKFQADLRRQRMTDLKCAGLALPAVEPFRRREDPVTVAGAGPSAANTWQVCAETRNILKPLEEAEFAALQLRWAIDDNFHDSYFAMTTLRDAIKENKVDDDFDSIAKMLDMDPDKLTKAQKLAAQPAMRRQVKAIVDRAFAITGRERNAMIDAEFGSPTDALFESEDDEMPAVSAAVRRKEMEIQENYQQARHQAELRRQRLKDLNCDALPTAAVASDNGSLGRTTTMLKQAWGPPEHHYTYGENWAEKIFIGDPPDRRRIRWTWEGVPGSLNPGDEFTITINGDLDFKPAGAERGANNSAFVGAQGLVAIKEENAYFYQGASRIGTYKYQVPRGAKKVVIELSADNNQGHFVRHCYGQCSQ